MTLRIIPVRINGNIQPGQKLDSLILDAIQKAKERLQHGDILIVGHKIVSKAEGRLVPLSEVNPSLNAKRIAKGQSKDPRVVQLILSESKEVVAMTRGIIISETKHGWVCANAGVDLSNATNGTAVLLPIDPDLSAAKLRRQISRRARVSVAVIISDTFGRPFRNGQANIAIGVSGIEPIKSYIGTKDMYGNILRVTEIAIADELASAAELVMGKTDSVPVAIIRGYMFKPVSRRGASELIRHKSADIFRCGSNSSAEHDIRIVPHAH